MACHKGTISDPTCLLNLTVEWFFHSNQTFFILLIQSHTSDNRPFFRKRKSFIYIYIYIYIVLYLFTPITIENTYLLCASIRLSPIPFTNRDSLHEKSVSSFWNYEQKHKPQLHNSLNHTFRNDNSLWKRWWKIKKFSILLHHGKERKIKKHITVFSSEG